MQNTQKDIVFRCVVSVDFSEYDLYSNQQAHVYLEKNALILIVFFLIDFEFLLYVNLKEEISIHLISNNKITTFCVKMILPMIIQYKIYFVIVYYSGSMCHCTTLFIYLCCCVFICCWFHVDDSNQ